MWFREFLVRGGRVERKERSVFFAETGGGKSGGCAVGVDGAGFQCFEAALFQKWSVDFVGNGQDDPESLGEFVGE